MKGPGRFDELRSFICPTREKFGLCGLGKMHHAFVKLPGFTSLSVRRISPVDGGIQVLYSLLFERPPVDPPQTWDQDLQDLIRTSLRTRPRCPSTSRPPLLSRNQSINQYHNEPSPDDYPSHQLQRGTPGLQPPTHGAMRRCGDSLVPDWFSSSPASSLSSSSAPTSPSSPLLNQPSEPDSHNEFTVIPEEDLSPEKPHAPVPLTPTDKENALVTLLHATAETTSTEAWKDRTQTETTTTEAWRDRTQTETTTTGVWRDETQTEKVLIITHEVENAQTDQTERLLKSETTSAPPAFVTVSPNLVPENIPDSTPGIFQVTEEIFVTPESREEVVFEATTLAELTGQPATVLDERVNAIPDEEIEAKSEEMTPEFGGIVEETEIEQPGLDSDATKEGILVETATESIDVTPKVQNVIETVDNLGEVLTPTENIPEVFEQEAKGEVEILTKPQEEEEEIVVLEEDLATEREVTVQKTDVEIVVRPKQEAEEEEDDVVVVLPQQKEQEVTTVLPKKEEEERRTEPPSESIKILRPLDGRDGNVFRERGEQEGETGGGGEEKNELHLSLRATAFLFSGGLRRREWRKVTDLQRKVPTRSEEEEEKVTSAEKFQQGLRSSRRRLHLQRHFQQDLREEKKVTSAEKVPTRSEEQELTPGADETLPTRAKEKELIPEAEEKPPEKDLTPGAEEALPTRPEEEDLSPEAEEMLPTSFEEDHLIPGAVEKPQEKDLTPPAPPGPEIFQVSVPSAEPEQIRPAAEDLHTPASAPELKPSVDLGLFEFVTTSAPAPASSTASGVVEVSSSAPPGGAAVEVIDEDLAPAATETEAEEEEEQQEEEVQDLAVELERLKTPESLEESGGQRSGPGHALRPSDSAPSVLPDHAHYDVIAERSGAGGFLQSESHKPALQRRSVNKTSEEYRALESSFRDMLLPYLQANLSGFRALEVLSFSKGSVVVNSKMRFTRSVPYNVTAAVQNVLEEFCSGAAKRRSIDIDRRSLDVEPADRADPCKFFSCPESTQCEVEPGTREPHCR
ncbi:hypothetical protein WMY93_015302 [Mugilogobius chulae]|uniref:Interphotoreceptor matrix proteoglycan 1 n=1 Tax=Mugilogobius chulae TaxID=88201 RepID=A0AAW0P146_9GOBI